MVKMNKAREKLIDLFVKSLEQDEIPWKRPWKSFYQHNGATGYRYRGINALLLSYIGQIKKYVDPRWLTFNQIKKKGYHLVSGSKGVPVEYWLFYDETNKRYLSIDKANQLIEENNEEIKLRLISKTTTVFNGSCIEGLPEYILQDKHMENDELHKTLNTLIDNMKIKVMTSNNPRAFYQPLTDVVHMPKEGLFDDYTSYASTLLHELAHATSHESRLDRKLSSLAENQESYAKEELRAEISSSLLADYFPIEMTEDHMQNHAAYIQSWISILKEQPNELFKAIKDADEIVDYMVEKAGVQKELDIVNVNEKDDLTKTKENEFIHPL